MAYDAAGARVGAAGHFASRLTAALITKGGIEPTPESAADTFAELTEAALTVLNGLEGASVQQTAKVIKANFPGTTEVGNEPTVKGGKLRFIGGSGDDHPSWIFEAARKAGVTAVYDNREDLAENPKRPWYKQAEPEVDRDDAKAFWPPRKGS